tara:strand:+ start:600 stop:1022 length:423 start_codon:yes stop_codon:yes gene_type:complete
MADSDFRDQTPFIARAREVFEEMGERRMFPGGSPVVRGYIHNVMTGSYTTPEEIEEALVEMEWDILHDYFPEEHERREAVEIAEGDRLARERYDMNPERYIETGNSPEQILKRSENRERTPDSPIPLPEGFRAGGRTRLI